MRSFEHHAAAIIETTLPSLPNDISRTVATALEEDIGSGDLTAALIPADRASVARVIVREPAVLCGTAWFDEVFRQLDPRVQVSWDYHDCDRVDPGACVCVIEGPARAILTGERTSLNFLQALTGTATTADRFRQAVSGTAAQLLDTRKTLPGLRSAQKYAVACGGCVNHRIGLYDAVLIKENHIAALGSISEAVARARELSPHVMIEVEVENLEQLDEALATSADRIMLDNFDLEQMRRAVAVSRQAPGMRKELEASGGLDFSDLREIAETGVDFISIGALTKNVAAIDFSMRIS